jgi:hypothetical protein
MVKQTPIIIYDEEELDVATYLECAEGWRSGKHFTDAGY